MRKGQRVPSPAITSGEGFCAQSGRDDRVGGLQDDASHLVGMREKRDMTRRDLTRRGLAALCHPTMLIGMDHAILRPKQRPCCAATTRWPCSCSVGITLLHPDPSAQNPCTRTMLAFCEVRFEAKIPMSVLLFSFLEQHHCPCFLQVPALHVTNVRVFPSCRSLLSEVPSATSRDFLCKMVDHLTAKVVTDATLHFLSGEQTSRFHNGPFAMHPMRLNAVELGTLHRQPARKMPLPDGPHARLPGRCDCAAGANYALPY